MQATPASVALAENIVREIFALYERHGQEDYGEGVTQLMHMTQAATLAQREGYDEEMILAAFLHDIGHFLEDGQDMGIYGKREHDLLGGDFLLRRGFSPKLAQLVASHVPTKRYLTRVDQTYYQHLSDASKKTLDYQGGPMTSEEAEAYAADPMIASYIKIRDWDDRAKETDIAVDPSNMAMIREMMTCYLSRRLTQ